MSFNFLISLVYLASAFVLFLIAGIILKENVKSATNRVVAAMLFWAGLAPLLTSIYNTVLIEPEQLPQSLANTFYLWELFFPTLLWFSVLFPEPLSYYNRHKRLFQLAFIPHVFHIFLVISISDPERLVDYFDFEISVPILSLIAGFISSLLKLLATFFGVIFSFHTKFFSLINLVYVMVSVYFLHVGFKRITNPALRVQVRVVMLGITAALGMYVIGVTIPTILSLKFPGEIREIFIVIALVVGPGSIGWAIIKYRFLDIGIIARQSLVYTITTTIVVGGYLLIITQLSSLFSSVFGLQSKIFDIIIVVVLLLFFQPIYSQVDDFVRRLFIRSKSDYRHLMEEFSRKLITVFEINRLSTIVSDTLNKEMFIERTYFALTRNETNTFKLLGESRAYSLEKEIQTLLLEKQQPVFINNLKKLAKEGHLVGRLLELNCHLLLPLSDKGKLIGVISTSQKVAGFRFTYEDLTLLSVLANQVVVAINNAQLYAESLDKQRLEEELAVARQIQMDLLPKNVPVHENYEFAAFNHPSRQVGGDYYDFIYSDNNCIGVVVADVSGKGVGAALLVARLQAVLQSEGSRGRPLATMLSGINDFLVSSTSADKYVTMFYGELNCDDRNFIFSNAGHNYPFVLKNNGEIKYLKDGGLVLGAISGADYEKSSLHLEKGDIMVIYTDGLTEAFNENEEEFGLERLEKLVRDARKKSAQFICGHLIKSIRQFTSDHSEIDDMTLVVIKGK